MTTLRIALHTGGCQCGAVRYAAYAPLQDPHICHCRMCQKAFGSYFAPLAGVATEHLAWTRGHPAVFKSSKMVERGFCAACGTPLSFRYVDGSVINISLGSLDDATQVAPAVQYGIESRVPFFEKLAALAGRVTEEDIPPARLRDLQSLQHPDQDIAKRSAP